MFLKKKSDPEPTPLDDAIEDVFSALKGLDEETEDYSNAVDQLVKLMKLKKDVEPTWQVSPDVLITTLANIAGILLVLQHERLHVIASKAFGLIRKL